MITEFMLHSGPHFIIFAQGHCIRVLKRMREGQKWREKERWKIARAQKLEMAVENLKTRKGSDRPVDLMKLLLLIVHD